MKTLFAVMALCLVVVSAQAADITKFRFQSYTAAGGQDCAIWGQGDRLKSDGGKNIVQDFAPDTSYSRSLVLGAHIYKTYSTVYAGNVHVTKIKFTCRTTSTGVASRVKVFMNDVETHFLTLDNGELTIGR